MIKDANTSQKLTKKSRKDAKRRAMMEIESSLNFLVFFNWLEERINDARVNCKSQIVFSDTDMAFWKELNPRWVKLTKDLGYKVDELATSSAFISNYEISW